MTRSTLLVLAACCLAIAGCSQQVQGLDEAQLAGEYVFTPRLSPGKWAHWMILERGGLVREVRPDTATGEVLVSDGTWSYSSIAGPRVHLNNFSAPVMRESGTLRIHVGDGTYYEKIR